VSALLDVDRVRIAYGKVTAVKDVTLRVSEGSIVTVIGANGAGKTTFLHGLIGLLPYQGHVHFGGDLLDCDSVEQRIERGIVLVAEKRELFAQMSVADNLLLGAYTRRREPAAVLKQDLDDIYRHFPRLAERRMQIAANLSGGERQMLALGRALMSRPKLLMLDEPSLGLAPLIVAEMFDIIKDLRSAGVSILLVEQNARAALAVSDYGYVLETGEITCEGESSQLATNPRVAAAYLGASHAV
jgi:branched-chain amino acid transport system ATP-binding protein